MKSIRTIVGISSYLLAALIAIAAVVSALSQDSIDYSIAKGRVIDIEFANAAAIVDKFAQSHGRLPTTQEFNDTVLGGTPRHESTKPFLYTSEFPAEVVERFGQPPKDGYILAYWRGEWMEHYASWKHDSTTAKTRNEYFFFGSVYLQTLAMLGVACALAVIGRRVRQTAEPDVYLDR